MKEYSTSTAKAGTEKPMTRSIIMNDDDDKKSQEPKMKTE